MNKRDKKILHCDFDYWIIFIYICEKNSIKIALFTDGRAWFPYITDDAIPFADIKNRLQKELGITEKHCFKRRFIPANTDINYEENNELNAAGSFIRLKDKRFLTDVHSKFKTFQWFTKEEALEKLEEKPYQVAFNTIFSKDTFWECLDTEKC